MSKRKLAGVFLGAVALVFSPTAPVFADMHQVVYASYDGPSQGVTVQNLQLQRIRYFETGVSASGIATGLKNDVYLASRNRLYHYSATGTSIKVMTFPVSTINYTSIAVRDNRVYASYTGSQQGVTVRDLELNQIRYFNIGINASSIAVGYHNDIYLSAGNQLYKYNLYGKLLGQMTFPDMRVVYTDIAVSSDGHQLYVSYTGSQQGVSIHDLNLKTLSSFQTSIGVSGITAGPNNDMYLASQNHLYNYDLNGKLLNDMKFPDSRRNHTDVNY